MLEQGGGGQAPEFACGLITRPHPHAKPYGQTSHGGGTGCLQSRAGVGWLVAGQVRAGVAVGESVGERRGKSALQAESDGRVGSAVAGSVCSWAANVRTC